MDDPIEEVTDDTPNPQTDAAHALAAAYRALPGLVPALIQGATVAEVAASLAPAQAAYRAIQQQVLAAQAAAVPPAHAGPGVPAPPAPGVPTIAAGVAAR